MGNVNRAVIVFTAVLQLLMNIACSDDSLLTAPASSPLLIIDFEGNLYKNFFNDPYSWSSAGIVYCGTTTDENHTRGGYTSYMISATEINHFTDVNINNNIGIESKKGVFPVIPGTTYLMSFWIKTENIVVGSWNIGTRVSVIVNDELGREVWMPTASGTNGWTRMYSYYTAEEGDRELFFRLGLNGSGKVWFDDMRVEAFEPDWEELYFIDFDDDSYLTWFNTAHNYTSNTVSFSGMTSDENHTPDGSRSLKVTASSIDLNTPAKINNAGIESKSTAFPVTVGKVYRISFWIKTENVVGGQGGGMGARPFILARDNNRSIEREIWSPNTTGTTGWKKMTYVYTAEETDKHKDTHLVVKLILYGSGTVWYDDVCIETED